MEYGTSGSIQQNLEDSGWYNINEGESSEEGEMIDAVVQTEHVKMKDKEINMHGDVMPFIRSYISNITTPRVERSNSRDSALIEKMKNNYSKKNTLYTRNITTRRQLKTQSLDKTSKVNKQQRLQTERTEVDHNKSLIESSSRFQNSIFDMPFTKMNTELSDHLNNAPKPRKYKPVNLKSFQKSYDGVINAHARPQIPTVPAPPFPRTHSSEGSQTGRHSNRHEILESRYSSYKDGQVPHAHVPGLGPVQPAPVSIPSAFKPTLTLTAPALQIGSISVNSKSTSKHKGRVSIRNLIKLGEMAK